MVTLNKYGDKCNRIYLELYGLSTDEKTIEKFEIILPSLDKQKEVVEKMSKIDEEISKAKQYVANASSAKQAILDKYLK